MSFDIVGMIMAAIGAIAACIAAVPVIKTWLPIKLSDKEQNILKLSVGSASFNGIFEYNLEPKPIVKIPYQHHKVITVNTEILELREKGLIRIMEGSFGQPQGSVWYQLTSKGYSLAKRIR
ncbi:hypothetical protein [Aliivibrio fischeri]|uniref:Uncharacterized protein n=1 Tax=Aliivibrio fischeri TaxID=668 RepID=A0A844P8B6_ALIFS|nr:hypothetical protein [Aliivibrio fischeri]MUK51478.1 hypothetical protein [Aliivibrio fischeri]